MEKKNYTKNKNKHPKKTQMYTNGKVNMFW